MLDLEKFKQFIISRGWDDARTAREIGIDGSYLYRILTKQRGIGKKFIFGMMNLCNREGLNIYDFIIPDTK